MPLSFTRALLGAAFTSLILMAAGPASAQKSCATDADCPQGHACHSYTVANPTEPGCKPGSGAECVRPDASPPPATTVMICEPKTCAADADCGAGMVCHAETSTECSGGTAVATPACPPNQPCDAGAPPPRMDPMCTTRTVKACAFPWQLPCNADSDCGVGFQCKPSVMGMCSGSAGSGTATPGGSSGSGGAAGGGSAPAPGYPVPVAPPTDGGTTMPPPPPMCTTTTSYPGWCAPRVTTCVVNSDCPANWQCEDARDTPVSSDPGLVPPGGARPAPAAADGGAMKSCVSTLAPPQRGGEVKVEAGGTATTGNGGGTGGDKPTVPPSPAAGSDAGTTPAAAKSSSGCAMSAGSGSSGAGLAAALILGLALARRRRRLS